MPIVRINNHIIYFAHVPKCGGTTIERGLIQSGHTWSFYDPNFFKVSARWYKSSPQHITTDDLKSLVDIQIFDYCFTEVRDPISRFLSAFNHNRGGNTLPKRKLPWHESAGRFLKKLEARDDYFSYRFDNHFVPADLMVPQECEVFHLEDGLEPVKKRLCEITGIQSDTLNFGHENKKYYKKLDSPSYIKRFAKKYAQPKAPKETELTREQTKKIKKLYETDYKRFYPESL